MNFHRAFQVPLRGQFRLATRDADFDGGYDKDSARKRLSRLRDRLAELQYLLYAENKHALLVVLQAMDAGGKDGTIRRVFSGVDPHGIRVTSFKSPSHEELEHDFLWRIHKAVPGRGEIAIHNRSHYEDVLVARVKNLVPRAVWSLRYDQINRFEQTLAETKVVILKFYLHVSKDEQKERLLARIHDSTKNWKFNPGDFEERAHWDDYMRAYDVVFNRCNAPWAPWFVIPANKKWFRDLAVASIVVGALESLRMKFPKPGIHLAKFKVR